MSEEFREVEVREEPSRFADNLPVLLSRPGHRMMVLPLQQTERSFQDPASAN